MSAAFKRVYKWLAPDADKEDDGRDKWPSRAAFVLAAMGGAVGLGNVLRYPSVVFANNGVQWFIPYLIALFFLGIPVLILEISIGQAYRGSVLVAFHGINQRTKGLGLGVILTGYVVATYYVPILGWVMHFFCVSFQSPLPWTKSTPEEFFMGTIIANKDPIEGLIEGSNVVRYVEYPGRGMVGETVGWVTFIWFCVYLCMFKGVAVTGRVVYFTMGLPIVMVFILMGRALSLDNAIDGVRMYFAEWHGDKLAKGGIWQAACGQIFFSIGVGFGYFTSYASYNTKYANAVQDAVIIGLSNSMYEVLAGFVVFGIIGFLGLKPEDVTLSTFTVGFLTYPTALAKMPGANVWAVLWFLTIAVVGLSSAFALIESTVTMLCDSKTGRRMNRIIISTAVVVISYLLSLLYCSEFGFYLLDAVDTWTNNLSLIFVVWCEGVAITTIYRYKDVCRQAGTVAYGVYTATYILSQVLGVAVAQAVGAQAGAGVGFGIFIVGNIVAVLVAKTPDSIPPRFWGNNAILSKFWWLSFYSGNQLRRDLNNVIATGKNWSIPFFWAPVIRYISCPILAIITSFAYPDFYEKRNDPLHIFAFAIAHVCMVIICLGFIIPRAFDVFVPPEKMHLGKSDYAPQVVILGVLTEDEASEAQASNRDTDEDIRYEEAKSVGKM